MRRLSVGSHGGELRARRWDVLILGGALPGLAAAARLGRAGMRVAVVEEEAAARTPALLREPFTLPAARPDGVVQSVLKALGFAPIDRHRFEPDEIAHQVLLPGARVDVGAPALTVEELVAWGLAKRELARAWVEGLATAARAEGEAMLAEPLIRRGLRSRGRPTAAGRGLPALDEAASPLLAAARDAQLRVLAQLGASRPSPEGAARLLGAALDGGAFLRRPGLCFRDMLRRRIEELHGEFRTVGTPFELVEVGGHPGIARRTPSEAWLGRVLLLNAPPAALGRALESWGHEVPGFLRATAPAWRRAAIQLRVAREALPEALARRAILVPDGDPSRAIGLAQHASERGTAWIELVATRSVPDEPAELERHVAELETAVRAFLPFAEGRVERAAVAARPLWDDELALSDPAPGSGWPGEVELRLSSRPPVYSLPREEVGALGSEGDLLLGWRAGDAIAAEL